MLIVSSLLWFLSEKSIQRHWDVVGKQSLRRGHVALLLTVSPSLLCLGEKDGVGEQSVEQSLRRGHLPHLAENASCCRP